MQCTAHGMKPIFYNNYKLSIIYKILNQYAVYLKLIHCKSNILQLKKRKDLKQSNLTPKGTRKRKRN